jgi:hypothetical protein
MLEYVNVPVGLLLPFGRPAAECENLSASATSEARRAVGVHPKTSMSHRLLRKSFAIELAALIGTNWNSWLEVFADAHQLFRDGQIALHRETFRTKVAE